MTFDNCCALFSATRITSWADMNVFRNSGCVTEMFSVQMEQTRTQSDATPHCRHVMWGSSVVPMATVSTTHGCATRTTTVWTTVMKGLAAAVIEKPVGPTISSVEMENVCLDPGSVTALTTVVIIRMKPIAVRSCDHPTTCIIIVSLNNDYFC